MSELKPMLDIEGQIKHLQDNGVKFEFIKVEEAKAYLENNNNYFKLTAYRKNFAKHLSGDKIGKYIDLDFAALKDLSIIDMRLRYFFIHMALDIEHSAKVKLIKEIESSNFNGYDIVEDYFNELKTQDALNNTNSYDKIKLELSRNETNPYCGDLIRKYKNEYPIWAFVEIITLGSFIHFYKFCANKLNSKDLINDHYLLLSIKDLRNACAHNNCIINDLSAKNSKYRPNHDILKILGQNGISKATRKTQTSNERINQILTLLYTHQKLVKSKGICENRYNLSKEIVERMNLKIELYKNNDLILRNFNFFEKIIDIFLNNEYTN